MDFDSDYDCDGDYSDNGYCYDEDHDGSDSGGDYFDGCDFEDGAGDLAAEFEVEVVGSEDSFEESDYNSHGEDDDDDHGGELVVEVEGVHHGGGELAIHVESETEFESESEEEFLINLPSSFLYRTPMRSQVNDDEGLDMIREINSTREMTIQASPLLNLSEIAPSSSNDGEERLTESNQEQGVGDLMKKMNKAETASFSEGKKMNESENDGVSCPICFEPWTSDGDHSICCLPCGHVYGMSCIKSWLQQPNSGKCPQCNEVCGIESIRKIYGVLIGASEKGLQEKIQLLEAKCASLELNDADWHRKEAEWLQKEALLLLQLKPDSKV